MQQQGLMGSLRFYLFLVLAGITLMVVVVFSIGGTPDESQNETENNGYRMKSPKSDLGYFGLDGRKVDREILANQVAARTQQDSLPPAIQLAPGAAASAKGPVNQISTDAHPVIFLPPPIFPTEMEAAIPEPPKETATEDALPQAPLLKSQNNGGEKTTSRQGQNQNAAAAPKAANTPATPLRRDTLQDQGQTTNENQAWLSRLQKETNPSVVHELVARHKSGEVSDDEYFTIALKVLDFPKKLNWGFFLIQEAASVQTVSRLADVYAKTFNTNVWSALLLFAKPTRIELLAATVKTTTMSRAPFLLKLVGLQIQASKGNASTKSQLVQHLQGLQALQSQTADLSVSKVSTILLSNLQNLLPDQVKSSDPIAVGAQ